ncbi:MAG: response regulator transcription factor [Eubacterium sp.]|nr:response regulator transcription factor [Eubacterium sp.]
MPENRLLILHRDEDICSKLFSYFKESGYRVIRCLDHEETVMILRQRRYDPELMIIGTGIPDRRDYDLIDHIREITDLPVVMLSEDDRLETQLYAYSKKIDDYMIMPAPLPLIEAHVEALLRRTADKKCSVVTAGALTIDYESRKIYLADQIIKVTAKEFDLMEFFVQHRGMILSRDKILDAVWGFDYVGGYRSVDTLVKKLRAKLTKDYPYIQTVYGVGYCFDV